MSFEQNALIAGEAYCSSALHALFRLFLCQLLHAAIPESLRHMPPRNHYNRFQCDMIGE
jgi:hypothetical protein